MSNSGVYDQRQSWRRQDSGGASNRMWGRILLPIAAIALVSWFVYLLWRPPRRTTNLIWIESSTSATGVLLPPRYADNARGLFQSLADQRTSVRFKPIRNQQRDAVREQINSPDFLPGDVNLDDDAIVVVVRGHLMLDEQDQPCLACSDVNVGGEPKLSGLLPIETLLTRMAGLPNPAKGSRIVVLDPQPQSSDARLGQIGDKAIKKLSDAMIALSGPAAKNVWLV
ncbi:MAG: hypothetical protein AAGA03_19150, partial [Planctomycetota bacterium]